jgi:predicted aldo/keto reductase-like oxidoreductase
MVMNLAEGPMKTAENCVQCDECSEKCPYELPVPDMVGESLEQYRQYQGQYDL